MSEGLVLGDAAEARVPASPQNFDELPLKMLYLSGKKTRQRIAQRAIALSCAAHGPSRVQSLPCGWRATPVPSARVEQVSMTRDAALAAVKLGGKVDHDHDHVC